VDKRTPRLWLKIAIACGALPMLSGVMALIIFLSSEVTASNPDDWVDKGVTILMGGLVFFFVGVVALGIYLVKGRREAALGRDLAQNVILTLILLLANFPVALACIWIAGDSFSLVRLHLVNESTTVVEDLNITWPGGEQHIGDLGPLDRRSLSFHVSGDGAVDFTARQGGKFCQGKLIGYVTTNMGETDDVAFLGECGFRVLMRMNEG